MEGVEKIALGYGTKKKKNSSFLGLTDILPYGNLLAVRGKEETKPPAKEKDR